MEMCCVRDTSEQVYRNVHITEHQLSITDLLDSNLRIWTVLELWIGFES